VQPEGCAAGSVEPSLPFVPREGQVTPGFSILHEHGPCLVVGKPSGLLTQAPPGIDCLEARIRTYLHARDGRPLTAHLGVVHRLDRPASGALLLGLTRRTTRALSRQMEQRQVRKLYWALVEGVVELPAGRWTDHLWKVPGEPRAEPVPADHRDARPAALRYRTLRTGPDWSWLEIELETGRTHQVRVQAASRGHPVLGDELYGSRAVFGARHEDPRRQAIALHARSLGFQDPVAGIAVEVVAPVADAWDDHIDRQCREESRGDPL
jgi:23S rRNA pseudouridine1911/1915/1917 synthase